MNTDGDPEEKVKAYSAGTYLRCEVCNSEIRIIRRCGCYPPDQVLRCCNRDMVPTKAGGERGFLS